MKARKLKKLKRVVQENRRKTAKERQAHSLAARAWADYCSAINDINNEYGTGYTNESFLR